jgi:hypothetical protein
MSTLPLSPEDGRAAADKHQELIPAHSDAALAPFLAKLERAIAARVDDRLATVRLVPVPAAGPMRRRRDRSPARRIIRDAVAIGGGALLVAAAVGLRTSETRPFGPVPVPRTVPMPYVQYYPGLGRGRHIVLLPAVVHRRGFGR